MARKFVWAAYRRTGRQKREWFASLDGLTWIAWPECPHDRDADAIQGKLIHQYSGERIATVRTSKLREDGFDIRPPRRMATW